MLAITVAEQSACHLLTWKVQIEEKKVRLMCVLGSLATHSCSMLHGCIRFVVAQDRVSGVGGGASRGGLPLT